MNNRAIEDREWFLLWFRLDHNDGYALWYSGEKDGLESVQGRIPYWKAARSAQEHAERKGYTITSETPKLHDLDNIAQVANGGELTDFRLLLGAWNLFSDVAVTLTSAEFIQLDQRSLDAYNHLFHLVGLGPFDGVHPPPLSKRESEEIRQLLTAGLKLFRVSLKNMDESNPD